MATEPVSCDVTRHLGAEMSPKYLLGIRPNVLPGARYSLTADAKVDICIRRSIFLYVSLSNPAEWQDLSKYDEHYQSIRYRGRLSKELVNHAYVPSS